MYAPCVGQRADGLVGEPRWLLDADRRLLEQVSATLEIAARAAGARLQCHLGCVECCLGPFPISALDALRLRRGLAGLEGRDPARAADVRRRAEAACRDLGWALPGGERERDRFFRRHATLSCPVLDRHTRGCVLYDFRPMTCRTFGPPVRMAEEDLPPCERCFEGATPEEIDRCRLEPDAEGFEDAILVRLERSEGAAGETLVALALAPGGRGQAAQARTRASLPAGTVGPDRSR